MAPALRDRVRLPFRRNLGSVPFALAHTACKPCKDALRDNTHPKNGAIKRA
jgi:hypothetical protein